jgi:pyridoxine kinase
VILSVQSSVAYGYVGNSSAVYLLQASGLEVCGLNTVALSGHVGRQGWQGTETPVQHLDALWRGLTSHGCVSRCRALIAGYLGSVEVAEWAWERARALPPEAPFICDPVMGDHGRLYVSPLLADFYRARIGDAAVAVPNAFELGFLSGEGCATLTSARAAVATLHRLGVPVVIAKGLSFGASPTLLHILASSGDAAHLVSFPQRLGAWVGTGDAFTALLVAAASTLPTPTPWHIAAACAASSLLDLIDASSLPGAPAPPGELAIPGFVPRLLPLRAELQVQRLDPCR